jgi:hypothetical protein
MVQNHVLDELAYIVLPQQQGRVGPRPQSVNGDQDSWESLKPVDEFHLADKTTIRAFDDIIVKPSALLS